VNAPLDTSDLDVMQFVLGDTIDRYVKATQAMIAGWEPAPMPDDYHPTEGELDD